MDKTKLRVRLLKREDKAAVFKITRNKNVTERSGYKAHQTMLETERMIDYLLTHKEPYCIDYNGECIGLISFKLDQGASGVNDCYEVGYSLHEDYWYQGIMKRMLFHVLTRFFEASRAEAVTAACFIENHASIKVVEALGFKAYKRQDYYAKDLGKVFKETKYILMREDFLKEANNIYKRMVK